MILRIRIMNEILLLYGKPHIHRTHASDRHCDFSSKKCSEPKNKEESVMDYGWAEIVGNEERRIKLPSGARKIVPSGCRAMICQVAGGSRTEKPMLKVGNAYHKDRVKRNSWPKVGLILLLGERLRGQAASAVAKTDKAQQQLPSYISIRNKVRGVLPQLASNINK
ncbi:hypothetical protein C5167_031017 [Papaver somniferum]|nr:hypothetical protein C5167_031017 [Papaver somniferum]